MSLSLRTAKNLFTSIKNVSKTLQSLAFCSQLGKKLFQAPARTCLSSCALSKTLSSGLKTPQSIQQILVNSQKNHTLSGSCPYVSVPSTHCQKSVIYSYLIYKNAATLITVSIRKKRPLRLIAVRVFSLYALSKIILYTQFQNLIYSLPQQLGLHTVPIIGENLQSIFLLNFSSKSIFHLFSTLSQQLWVGW